MHKRLMTISLIGIIVVVLCFQGVCMAQQGTQSVKPVKQENKVVTFFKNLVVWPFSVTKQGAETVGKTAKSGIETGTNTATSAVETVTGKPEKIKDVIVEPIKGAGETAVTAVKGTVETPIEGTKEAFENKN